MTDAKPKGWLYLITNRAMPDLVKVGFSMKDPSLRAKDLQNTGVPHSYDVVYEALVPDPYVLEQRVHRALARFREGKEWFRCDLSVAYEAVRQIASSSILFESTGSTIGDFHTSLGEQAYRAWEASNDINKLNEAVRHHYAPAVDYAISFFRINPDLNTAKFDLSTLKLELLHHYMAAGANGDASAYYEAVCLAEGDEDCALSSEEIARLLRLASNGGCIAAIARLAADSISSAKTADDAAPGIEKLDEMLANGYWQAGVSLATFYEQGIAVAPDSSRALKYWEKVASLSGGSLWKSKVERVRKGLMKAEDVPQPQSSGAA